MPTPAPKPFFAFYGDDFTGSTDALEFLSRAGVRTALFIEPPSAEQLGRYPDIQAVGVAGMTRSLPPRPMADVLAPAFRSLRELGVRHLHYKVCSTFDSSPTIGSIGKAIETGRSIFNEAPFVPVVVGAPALGRYCVFGNLFARFGIGSHGAIHRLDRHPSASRHPTTPADEADLRLHLARQTSRRMALFDILHVALPETEANEALERMLADEDPEIVFFDLLDDSQLSSIGRLIEARALPDAPLFSVGSSGIEMALGAYWNSSGVFEPVSTWEQAAPADPLLVISGSCSPVTARQIEQAVGSGFAEVALDTPALVRDPPDSSGTHSSPPEAAAFEACREHLSAGRSVILHTSRNEDDRRIRQTAEAFALRGFDPDDARSQTAPLFGSALGRIARGLLGEIRLRRLVLAGGDSSSHAARALGIEAVEMIAPLAPGAPLCRASAPGSPADGIEINFKGGQVGADDYFSVAAAGRSNPDPHS